MKTTQLTLLMIMALLSISGYCQTKKVLYVGNSYTYTNDLPNMIEQIALSEGKKVLTTKFLQGGATFYMHAHNEQLKNTITNGGYDIMVLQGQSQEVAFPASQFAFAVYPDAKFLDSLFKAHNPNGKVIFFMTWGRENGDADNCQYYEPFCSYQSMSEELCKNYTQMAEDFSSDIAPIGKAWLYTKDNYPSYFNLFSSDGSHPSVQGSYLSACVLYTKIFNKEINSNYLSSLSEQTAMVYQNIANAFYTDNNLSSCSNNNATLDEIISNEDSILFNYDILSDCLKIKLTNYTPSVQVKIISVMGKVVKQVKNNYLDNITILTNDIKAGYYVVEVNLNNQKKYFKFVKG